MLHNVPKLGSCDVDPGGLTGEPGICIMYSVVLPQSDI